ncbi:MAG: endonuclease/exonuclease/phosphatase family protein [Sulfurospirillaceae bacterium]|nr:endonuclease/exonuclease/phosphatase family protein [Sulfurospirillaceae bacterium]
MMKPNLEIKLLKNQEISCAKEFTILCWNVAKLTNDSIFINYLEKVIKDEKIDILLLQEFKKSITKEIKIGDYSYVLSPNMETKKNIFGVLSAFKIHCEDNLALLSKRREFRYLTHKSSLITTHKLNNSQKLLIVHVHAINFVKNSDFYNEIDYIKTNILSHKGAMILAGDFNTWNSKRSAYLREMTNELSLKEIIFEDDKHRKKFFTQHLDHIFYRGFNLLEAKVLNSKNISDHNPIIAKLAII